MKMLVVVILLWELSKTWGLFIENDQDEKPVKFESGRKYVCSWRDAMEASKVSCPASQGKVHRSSSDWRAIIRDSETRSHGFQTSTCKHRPLFEHINPLSQQHPKEITARVPNRRDKRSLESYQWRMFETNVRGTFCSRALLLRGLRT